MRISDWSSDVFSSDLAIRYAITGRIQRATLGINLHALGGSRAQIGVVRHTVAIRILGSFGCAGGLRTQCGDQANLDDGFAEAVGTRDIPCTEPALAEIGAQDRTSVGKGKGVAVREDLGGRRIINKKKK